jgi:predicted nucleic acid-binding Zn ribbon protein
MMNSQTLHIILEADGPAKQTRAKIKRCLVPSTTKDRQDGARPSGTSSNSMDLTD